MSKRAQLVRRLGMKTTGYIETNGIDYYYEIRGRGQPLLLLHGGLGNLEMFGPVLTALADHHQIIGVELQGHGRTSLGERAMSLPAMADDMAAILDKLGYRQVDVLGYSLGAGVAFRLAVQHPASVRKLVIVSAGVSTDAFYPEMLPMQAQLAGTLADALKPTPMGISYAKLAPHPEQFPRLLDRMGELMRTSFDWRDDAKRVAAHTLLVFGDSDMFQLDKVVEFYKLLGGGQRDAGWMREHIAKNRLAILPDVTHYDMFVAPQLVPTMLAFLSKP